jgi:hypothetical protein
MTSKEAILFLLMEADLVALKLKEATNPAEIKLLQQKDKHLRCEAFKIENLIRLGLLKSYNILKFSE